MSWWRGTSAVRRSGLDQGGADDVGEVVEQVIVDPEGQRHVGRARQERTSPGALLGREEGPVPKASGIGRVDAEDLQGKTMSPAQLDESVELSRLQRGDLEL